MANQWLRLWHDMPNDPKWRTIARISEQKISLVLAMFAHLLVDASQNVTRGHVTVTHEDLASALDESESAISAIWNAMQGRVLDGNSITGWDKRQVKREEPVAGESPAKSAAERKRDQREREKGSRTVTTGHAKSREVTPDKDKEEDTDKEEKKKTAGADAPDFNSMFTQLWDTWPAGYGEKGSRKNAEAAFLKLKPDKPLFAEMLRAVDAQARDKASKQASGQFFANFKHVERWIRNQEWKNEISSAVVGQGAHARPDSGIPHRESTVDRNSRKAAERSAALQSQLDSLGAGTYDAVGSHG